MKMRHLEQKIEDHQDAIECFQKHIEEIKKKMESPTCLCCDFLDYNYGLVLEHGKALCEHPKGNGLLIDRKVAQQRIHEACPCKWIED